MMLWLAPVLGLLAYAVGVAVARTDPEALLRWERRTGLRLCEWVPCPVGRDGAPRARAFYCMSGIVLALLGLTGSASLTLISLLG